jgi:hypothetical protein
MAIDHSWAHCQKNHKLMPLRSLFFTISMLLFSGQLIAAECDFPFEDNDKTADVWPFLANATLTGVLPVPVALRAGQYSGEPFVPGGQARPELQLWPELLLSADLDGNSGAEKIGILSATLGGSGELIYLLVAQAEQEQFYVLPALLLGDRIKIRSLAVEDQHVVLEIIEAGENQPLCCGTQFSRLLIQLVDGELIIQQHERQGELSLAMIQGKDWYLLERPGDRINAQHPSCMRLSIADHHVELTADGQLFGAKIKEIAPGQMILSDLTPRVESDSTPINRLMNNLMNMTQYNFRAGRLLLSGQVNDRWHRFEFVARPSGESIH